MKTEGRVAVLMGGVSSEREVSLETGAGVIEALKERGHEVVGVDWAPGTNPAELLDAAGAKRVWIALHGTHGEDGAVQGMLQCLGLAYTGSGILASAMAMDKIASKRQFEAHRLPTPAWALVSPGEDPASLAGAFGTPLVVKPSGEGSSVGVSIAGNVEEIRKAIEHAAEYRSPILVEKYIRGAELHVGILGEEVLGTIEVKPKSGFYDYEAKYKRDDTEYLIPATVSPDTVERSERIAREAHVALGCSGHSRVDLRIDEAGQPFILEVNTLPGMTGHSLLPKIASHRGISYGELCERILELSIEPH